MSRIMTTVITSLLFTGMGLAQNTSASDQETIRLLVQQVKEGQGAGSQTVGLGGYTAAAYYGPAGRS